MSPHDTCSHRKSSPTPALQSAPREPRTSPHRLAGHRLPPLSSIRLVGLFLLSLSLHGGGRGGKWASVLGGWRRRPEQPSGGRRGEGALPALALAAGRLVGAVSCFLQPRDVRKGGRTAAAAPLGRGGRAWRRDGGGLTQARRRGGPEGWRRRRFTRRGERASGAAVPGRRGGARRRFTRRGPARGRFASTRHHHLDAPTPDLRWANATPHTLPPLPRSTAASPRSAGHFPSRSRRGATGPGACGDRAR